MMMFQRLFALCLFIAWLAMIQSQSTCHFEQFLNNTQTSNTAYVQWRVNLNTPSTPCSTTNPHIRQGVLKITVPQNATKIIIRLHQTGETCFASWHLAMDWTDGYSGRNAEIHTVGNNMDAFSRGPGPGPDQRPSGIYRPNFVSKTTATKLDVSMYKVTSSSDDQYNIVDKVYPPCDTKTVSYINQNMFRIDDMKRYGVYLGLNRVVNGRSGREGAGLYYVCVVFQ